MEIGKERARNGELSLGKRKNQDLIQVLDDQLSKGLVVAQGKLDDLMVMIEMVIDIHQRLHDYVIKPSV